MSFFLLNIRLLWQSIKHFIRTYRLNRKNNCTGVHFRSLFPQTKIHVQSITSCAIDKNRVLLYADNGSIQIDFLEENLFSIRLYSGSNFNKRFSYAIDETQHQWNNPVVTVNESTDTFKITSTALTINVQKKESVISVADKDGAAIIEDMCLSRLQDSDILRAAFKHRPGTRYHGLGERATGLDLNGGSYELWNTDPSLYDRGDDPLYLNVPFLFMMQNGTATGLFIDNPYRSSFDINSKNTGTVEYRTAGGELCIYIMTGTPSEVIQHYTSLTGRMNMPPLWALGYHQSRWSYYPRNKVLEIANEFRKRKLPCDVIHIDIDYMNGYRCFTWDKKRFPKPKEMIDILHKQGFKVLTMIDPGIKVDPEYHVYREGIEKDVFLKYPCGTCFTGPVWPGDCHFPDFTDPNVREWWGTLYKDLLDDGIDAFWNDMNEIALITFLTGSTVPDCIRHSFESNGADHAEMHNYYGMLMARASAEGIRKLRPEKRAFVLSRSGWAGLQRYAVNWTGDNRSTWDHLRLSVSMVLNLGLSGIPFTGPDIGGFAGKPSPELFARWMQLGAFLPFFRTHTMKGTPGQEPWSFGTEVESICRKYLELRYRLLPYLYTAVWQAHKNGIPIVRPLWFMYPKDRTTYDIEDQFLYGDSILVAPVLHRSVQSRTVYLPGGDDWYDFRTNKKYRGGQYITTDAPVDTLPLFVKAGSVLPRWPVQQYSGEKNIDTLELVTYWSDKKNISLLYEDDGNSMAYHKENKCRLTEMSLDGKEQGTLRLKTSSGETETTYESWTITPIGLPDTMGPVKIIHET